MAFLKKIIPSFILFTLPVVAHAGIAWMIDASNDYQVVTAKEPYYGKTWIASRPIPSYSIQFSTQIWKRLGIRLKYKIQNAVYYSPDEKNLSNKTHTLTGKSIELPFQHNRYFQSFFRFRNQDRVLIDMAYQENTFKLRHRPTNDYGWGFNLESDNSAGFRAGISGWGTLVTFGNPGEEDPTDGLEFGVGTKIAYQTRMRFGLFAKAQYTWSQFKAESYTFSIKEGSIGGGLLYYFGK